MTILIIITITGVLIITGLLVEKMIHFDYSLKEISLQLKADIGTVAKAFFQENIQRHIFNPQLAIELRNVARPYSNTAFDIDVFATSNSGTPYIGINFIPSKKYEIEELNEITSLLQLKFRRYMLVNELNLKSFSCFSSGHDFINVFLYYAELPEDIENFMYRYRMTLKEKVDTDYGLLQDEDLNKELQNVDNNRL